MEYTIVIETHAGQKMVHTIITGDLTEKARDRISAETIQLLNDRRIHKREYEHAKNVTKSIKLNNLNYFQSIDQGIGWLISRG